MNHFHCLILALAFTTIAYAAPTNRGSEICIQQPRDLFFVVDGSASMNPSGFEKVRTFLIHMLSSVHIHKDITHVGMLQFSDKRNTDIVFGLDFSYDKEKVVEKVAKIPYPAGKATLTNLALDMVVDKVFTKTGGDRANVQDIVLFFTDGRSTHREKTMKSAKRLKKLGVRVIAVGVNTNGNQYLWEELRNIASSDKDMIVVRSFSYLARKVPDILSEVCRPVTTIAQPTTIPATTTPEPTTTLAPTTTPEPITTTAPTTTLLPTTTVPPTTTPEPTTTQPPTTTPVPTTTETPTIITPTTRLRAPQPKIQGICTMSKPKDVLFLVDGTVNSQLGWRKSEKKFNKLKRFIQDMISRIDNSQYMVGVSQFGGYKKPHLDVDFTNITEEALLGVELMQQHEGQERRISEALVDASNQFYKLDSQPGLNRMRNPDVVVLIIRGRPSRSEKEYIQAEIGVFKARGIRLIAIGTGITAKYLSPFLNEIVEAKDAITARYAKLKRVSHNVLGRICTDKSASVSEARVPHPAVHECKRTPHDVFFVVDGSSSIEPHNFNKVRKFLLDLVYLLKVGTSSMNTGLLQYSQQDLTSIILELNPHHTDVIARTIQTMSYQNGKKTMTGDALKRVNDQVFIGEGGDRAGVNDILIIFTDGTAHDEAEALKQAELLKKKGVIVIAIAARRTGQNIKFDVLKKLASREEYALTVNFKELGMFAKKVFPFICASSSNIH